MLLSIRFKICYCLLILPAFAAGIGCSAKVELPKAAPEQNPQKSDSGEKWVMMPELGEEHTQQISRRNKIGELGNVVETEIVFTGGSKINCRLDYQGKLTSATERRGDGSRIEYSFPKANGSTMVKEEYYRPDDTLLARRESNLKNQRVISTTRTMVGDKFIRQDTAPSLWKTTFFASNGKDIVCSEETYESNNSAHVVQAHFIPGSQKPLGQFKRPADNLLIGQLRVVDDRGKLLQQEQKGYDSDAYCPITIITSYRADGTKHFSQTWLDGNLQYGNLRTVEEYNTDGYGVARKISFVGSQTFLPDGEVAHGESVSFGPPQVMVSLRYLREDGTVISETQFDEAGNVEQRIRYTDKIKETSEGIVLTNPARIPQMAQLNISVEIIAAVNSSMYDNHRWHIMKDLK